MKAFQCDRCHGFYTEKATVNVELGNEICKNVNIFCDTQEASYKRLDLCPSCLNSLAEWLQYKELKEGAKQNE